MEDTKPWWASKTIWTGVAQVVIGTSVATGIIDNATANNALGAAPEVIGGVLSAIVGTATVITRITDTPKPVTLGRTVTPDEPAPPSGA